jgi:hypothetical protein
MTCASEGSEAAMVAWREVLVDGSRMLVEMERKRASRASWVRPRWVRDPKIVWDYSISFRFLLHISKLTFPEPVTPRVANNPSLPSPPWGPRTPSTKGNTPVPWKMSSWVLGSSNTFVNANFSTALRRLSFGGLRVICVGSLSCSASSTVKNRSGLAVEGKSWPAAGGGRRRRYTSKRVDCGF